MLPRSSSHSDDHYDDGGYCDDEDDDDDDDDGDDDDDDDDDGELPEASCSAQSQFLGCCEQAGRRGKQMSEISKSFRSGMGADKKARNLVFYQTHLRPPEVGPFFLKNTLKSTKTV